MPKADQLKLHEAMIVAMIRKRRYRIDSEALARWISELDLYRRWKDDDHPPAWQVVRRAKRYEEFFVVVDKGKKKELLLRINFPEFNWSTWPKLQA